MNSITVSSPGKLMLFGEHAVVYNRPCLVTAVDQRMKVKAEILGTMDFQLEAPEVKITGYKKSLNELGKGDIPKGAKFVELAVRNVFDYANSQKILKQIKNDMPGLRVTTSSEFSSKFGFGSSSASTVCTIKAVSELIDLKLSQKEMFDLAYKTVLDVQGKGSGFDVAAGIYGGTLHFVTGGEFIDPLDLKTLPLIVGYTGIKADTVSVVNEVQLLSEKYPETIEEIYNDIEDIVVFAKEALLDENLETLGQLMNFNQGYLEALGVSNKKLSNMIYAARDAGAYGAKLSGAGKGDCMIAISDDAKRKEIEDAITKDGGEIINIKANAEGVRVE